MHQIYNSLHNNRIQQQKRELLGQNPVVVWMTGLSGAGKSTIATELEKRLVTDGFITQWLDGDMLREGLTKDLGFTEEDRTENIRRAAEVAKLFYSNGIITICTFISPMQAMRQQARQIIGDSAFLEVYINCPLEVCVQRDVKGLYSKALNGLVVNLSGVDAPYEAPYSPWLELHTHYHSVEKCTEQLYQALLPRIKRS